MYQKGIVIISTEAYVKNIGEDIELEQTELFSKSEIEDLAKCWIV